MWRSRDLCRHPGARGQGGFTLIEVIVAIGIMVLVTAALTPQVVAGLRSAGTARDITQAKGVAQARIEQIRNMPYYVGRAAGDYIDVLDTYYRNTTPPTTAATDCSGTTVAALPPTSWTGYVPVGASRCAWEPATGPFYRRVVNPIEAPGLGTFAMVVSTQFLSSATPPGRLAPLAGYDSQVAGKDAPASSQLGITVAVFYVTQSGVRYTSTRTQVEQASPIAPLLESHARSATVTVSSATSDGTLLLQQLGVVNLAGELFTGSRVVATATAGTATTSSGEQATGATLNLVAPVDTASQLVEKSETNLPDACARMCFGKSKVDQMTALASSGLPRAGTPTAPVRSYIRHNANQDGFRFSNGAAGTRLRLDASRPMVSVDTGFAGSVPQMSSCAPASGTLDAHLVGTGYLTATSTTVESCATGQTTVVRLFPTDYASGGIVRIVLDRATSRCVVDRASGSWAASADYRATLSYWNGSGYTAVALGSHLATDPLAGPLPDASLDGTGLKLADYISSWRSLTTGDLVRRTATRTAEAGVPGAITIITQPTREGVAGGTGDRSADARSAISISIGDTSCKASDQR